MKKSNKIISTVVGGIFVAILVMFVSFNAFSASDDDITLSTVVTDQGGMRVVGNGKIISKSIAVTEFDAINVGGETDVSINSGKQNVVVTTDENIFPYMNIAVSDKLLDIDTKSGVAISPSQTEKIQITAFSLYKISLHGKTVLNATNINSKDLTLSLGGKSTGNLQGDIKNLQINLHGDSELHLSVVNAESMALKIVGKGMVSLSGKVNNLSIITGGNATVDAKNLVANDVTIVGAGESNMTVYAVKKLSISTAGKSNVQYYGNPEVSKRSFGEATIEQLHGSSHS